jgi:hypothetical protein
MRVFSREVFTGPLPSNTRYNIILMKLAYRAPNVTFSEYSEAVVSQIGSPQFLIRR